MTQINNLYETYQLFMKCKKFYGEFELFTHLHFNTIVFTRYGKIQKNVFKFIREFYFEHLNDFFVEDNFNKNDFIKIISKCRAKFEIIDKILVKQRKLSIINETSYIEIDSLNNQFDKLIIDKKIKNDEINSFLDTLESDNDEPEESNNENELDNLIKQGKTIKFSYSFMKKILNQETIQN